MIIIMMLEMKMMMIFSMAFIMNMVISRWESRRDRDRAQQPGVAHLTPILLVWLTTSQYKY